MQLLILFLAVLLISYIATLCWVRLAKKRHLFDRPNSRSSHAVPTPTSGGIGFVIAFSFFTLILFLRQVINLNEFLFFSAAVLLAITGFFDDLKNLSIQKRLFAQFAVCCFVVLTVESLPAFSIFGGLEIGGVGAKILLLFGFIWLVNLYNFMDGIDGLAAAEAIFFAISIALLTISAGNSLLSIIALGLAISLCGFLYFNLPPAAIFMGDLGSNYLGFVLGLIGILGIVSEAVNVWTILVLLGVFIVDSTTTLLGRITAGAIWYHGHNLHAYQYAARRLGSHGKVVAVVCAINVLWLFPLSWMTIRYEQAGLLITGLAWTPVAILGMYCKRANSLPASN